MKKLIAKYEIVSDFATSDDAEYFKAKDPDDGKIVLIKLYNKKFKPKKELTDIFKKKVAAISDFKTKHIVPIYSAGKNSGNRFFVVSKLIDGESLDKICERHLESKVILRYFYDVAKTLDKLHKSGIKHLNLKLSNIIIRTKDDRVFLTDFNPFQQDTDVPTTDLRNDLFLCAVALYQALFGKLPFGANSLLEILTSDHEEFDGNEIKYNPEILKVFKKVLDRPAYNFYNDVISFVKAVAQASDITVNESNESHKTHNLGSQFKRITGVFITVGEQCIDNIRDSRMFKSGGFSSDRQEEENLPPYLKKTAGNRMPNLQFYFVFALLCVVVWFLFSRRGSIETQAVLETQAISNKPIVESSQILKTKIKEQPSSLNNESNVTVLAVKELIEEKEETEKTKTNFLKNLTIDNSSLLTDEQILTILNDKTAANNVLHIALLEVGSRGKIEFYKPLGLIYNHSNSNVRSAVALALKHDNYIGQNASLIMLVNLLQDEDMLVRGLAAKSLAKLGTNEARSALSARLRVEKQQAVKNAINNSLEIAIDDEE